MFFETKNDILDGSFIILNNGWSQVTKRRWIYYDLATFKPGYIYVLRLYQSTCNLKIKCQIEVRIHILSKDSVIADIV